MWYCINKYPDTGYGCLLSRNLNLGTKWVCSLKVNLSPVVLFGHVFTVIFIWQCGCYFNAIFVAFWFESLSFVCIRDFNGHLPYPFQNPISNFYLSLEAGKSSTDSVILRKLTNVEIIFRAWTKSLKRTKLYFDD